MANGDLAKLNYSTEKDADFHLSATGYKINTE